MMLTFFLTPMTMNPNVVSELIKSHDDAIKYLLEQNCRLNERINNLTQPVITDPVSSQYRSFRFYTGHDIESNIMLPSISYLSYQSDASKYIITDDTIERYNLGIQDTYDDYYATYWITNASYKSRTKYTFGVITDIYYDGDEVPIYYGDKCIKRKLVSNKPLCNIQTSGVISIPIPPDVDRSTLFNDRILMSDWTIRSLNETMTYDDYMRSVGIILNGNSTPGYVNVQLFSK